MHDITIKSMRLKTSHLVSRTAVTIEQSPDRLQTVTRREAHELEEVLSNGTMPQDVLSRPSYTGYSRTRNGKFKPFPCRADGNEFRGAHDTGSVTKFNTFDEDREEP